LLGLVGTQRRLDYTAIGDSVNTAKRLQQNAAPGQILASAGTADQIQPWVELRPVAPIAAEGKGRPLEACEVVGLL
jgi:class 3 adenylate cyclase